MSGVKTIVLTGAPCSGKTYCLRRLEEYYRSRGYNVIVCPETAAFLIESGASRDDMLEFESAVAHEQLDREDRLRVGLDDTDTILLLDRGVVDCFSYVDEQQLADAIGMTPVSAWDRYDAVLFLETAAISGDYIGDDIRTEDAAQARRLHQSLLNVWMGHPHLRYIPYSPYIDAKMSRIIAEIDGLLSETEIEKKLLIEYPDITALGKYDIRRVVIHQAYLPSLHGTHRIRKRGCDGVYSYYETVKLRITDSQCKEYERTISRSDYESLLLDADSAKNVISKDRYCILYDGQYIELDIFPFWDDRALVEIELLDINAPWHLPPELTIISDVSEDYHYKNNYLASLKS